MPSQSAETPLFDPIAIEKLRKVAGDQGGSFVAELAQLFIDETIKSLDELKRGRDEGDWKRVTRLAHSLKSSAATLGLMRLSVACQALELHAKGRNSGPETNALIASVVEQFEQATPTLKGLA